MNWNNESNGQKLVFDLETYPLDEAAEYLIEPIEPPVNYKDPVKIEAYIAGKKAEQIARCALDPDLCRIVALGVWEDHFPEPEVFVTEDDTEANLLTWFWNEAEARHLVGFNCLEFDLLVLLRRSLYLGVSAPTWLSVDKYRHPEVTDLYQVLSYGRKQYGHSLDFYAKRFGVDVKDDYTGADIGRLVAEGKWNDVRNHCLADVKKTAAVAEKCGLFSLKPAPTIESLKEEARKSILSVSGVSPLPQVF